MSEAPLKERYGLHKLALRPLSEISSHEEAYEIAGAIETLGIESFVEFLNEQGLMQLWHAFLQEQNLSPKHEELYRSVQQHAKLTAAHQLLQRNELKAVHGAFSQQSIPYFVFKGANLRDTLYSDPTQRPVSDIDIYVRKHSVAATLNLMTDLGYRLHLDPETASHEASLVKGEVCIDLHWHLMRPGRSRVDLTEFLFSHREGFSDGLWGLDCTASTLVMLIHPAITKYLLSPTSMLIHLSDQAKLIYSDKVDWSELERILNMSGMRTAAWSSLYVLGKLTNIEAPNQFQTGIQPGRTHAWYLRQWIDRAWTYKLFRHRRLVAGFFSLALQDSFRDAAIAFRTRLRRNKMALEH